MRKEKSPVYGRRKRGGGLRSFFVVLLGSAAIALAGAGVWQLLDPVDYQPPLEPLTSRTMEESSSQPEEQPPEEESSPASQPEEEAESAASGPEVQEGEWLASEYFDDALFIGDSITEGIRLYDVMSNVTVLATFSARVREMQRPSQPR